MGQPSKQDSRSIEATLAELGIDSDAGPEDAATEAAREAATTTTLDDPDGDEGGEGKSAPLPDPGPARTRPTKPKGKKEAEDEGEGDEEDEDDGDIIVPPPAREKPKEPTPDFKDVEEAPVLIPAPKPPKPKTRSAPSGAAKLGKDLAGKVPGAEKVKVYKREKDGKIWFVHEYTKGDLAGHTDFESFLTEYVKEEHGSGEYTLKGVDGMGREMDLGVVRLRGVPSKSADQGALSVIQQIMAQNQRRDAEYLKRMEETMRPQQQQDPLSLLTGVMTLQKQLKEDAEQGNQNGGGMEALVKMMSSSGDKTMQMMMMMMQQQQQAADRQTQIMMSLLAKPKEEDPVTKLLLTKLMEDKKEDSPSGNLPPPPPPPKDNTVELITALGSFMAAMGGSGDGDDDFKEFLKQQLSSMSQNQLSTKDALELVNNLRDDSKGGDKLKEAADNMALVMNMANSFNRQQEGGASAGLFDALAALFSNRDFAGSIAQTIRAKTGGAPAPQQPAAQLTPVQQTAVAQLSADQQTAFRQLPPQQQVAIANKAVQLQYQQRQQAAPAAAPGPQTQPQPQPQPYPVATPGPQPYPAAGGQPQPAPAPAATPGLPPGYVMTPQGPMPAAQAQGGPPVAPTAPTAATPPTEETQRAAEQELANSGKLPELPANTWEHIENLVAAQDDEGELVGKTVSMLIYFAEFDKWRQFSEMTLGLARAGEKAQTLEYLGAFFDGLIHLHMIDKALAQKVLGAVNTHFASLQEQLSDLGLEQDSLLTGDDLIHPDGEPAGADEGDEGTDVGQGGGPEDFT